MRTLLNDIVLWCTDVVAAVGVAGTFVVMFLEGGRVIAGHGLPSPRCDAQNPQK